MITLFTVPPHDLDADSVAGTCVNSGEEERTSVGDRLHHGAGGGLASPERAQIVLASLAAYLRSRTVTAYMTIDVPTIVGFELSFAGAPLVPFNENLLLLRFADYDGELHRLFCVRIIGTAPGAHRLLTSLARPLKSGPSWPAAGGRR